MSTTLQAPAQMQIPDGYRLLEHLSRGNEPTYGLPGARSETARAS